MLEFEKRRSGILLQRGHVEKEGSPVARFEMRGDLGFLDYGRQLMQIAKQEKPDAAERLARSSAIDAQRLVDSPHEVRAHHRHLVDNQGLEATHDAAVAV